MKQVFSLSFIAFCLLSAPLAARVKGAKQFSIGHFSLPISQQPGLFYAFGSNLIDKGQTQITFAPDVFKTTGQRYVESSNAALYGMTDNASLLLMLPTTFSYTHDGINTKGFGDINIQGEYGLYTRQSTTDFYQVAAIAGFTAPTGQKDLSYNTVSYFLAGSVSHIWQDWLIYAAPGVLLFDGPRQDRFGTQTFYEIGGARNIASEPGRYIFDVLFEINGQYDAKTPTQVLSPHQGSVFSAGHILFFSPGLWYSTPHWIYLVGASIPITQHWKDTPAKVNDYVSASITWTV